MCVSDSCVRRIRCIKPVSASDRGAPADKEKKRDLQQGNGAEKTEAHETPSGGETFSVLLHREEGRLRQ